MTVPLIIYADGSHDPVIQAGGWAFVVYEAEHLIHKTQGKEAGITNNRFEVLAVLNALKWLKLNAADRKTILRTDSTHVVEGCHRWRAIWRGNGWKRINPNQRARKRQIPDADLWQELDSLLLDQPGVDIEWCKGHSGIEGNELADSLARSGT